MALSATEPTGVKTPGHPRLLLFVRAPTPGRCKTRLSPPLSPLQGAALYRAFCVDVLTSARATGTEVHLAYAPSNEQPNPTWLASDVPSFEQQGPTLGDRLIHAFETIFRDGPGPVAVIGTDAPTLSATQILETFSALPHVDAVFIPAEDGGYCLAGLSQPQPSLFKNIPWSTSEVMATTLRAAVGLRVQTFPPHYDVDTPQDLQRLSITLQSLPDTIAPKTRQCLRELTAGAPC